MDYFIVHVKASSLPGLLLATCIAFAVAAASPARAQDKVALRSGPVREGKVVGVSGTNLQLEIKMPGSGALTKLSLPLADVTEITMDDPPEFTAAADRLAKGDAKGAAAALDRLTQAFAGLPAAWAQRASAMLGDAKLAAGDKAGAKAAYERFAKTYPQATALADLGMARLAVDEGKFKDAQARLSKLLASSDKTVFPPAAQAPMISQGHYLMGRVLEESGDNQGALENYLKASAVFPFDRNAASDAQARADDLRAKNPGLIAP